VPTPERWQEIPGKPPQESGNRSPSPPNPARNGRDIEYVIEHWIFPMAGLELTQSGVKVEQLRRRQQEWLYSMEGW